MALAPMALAAGAESAEGEPKRPAWRAHHDARRGAALVEGVGASETLPVLHLGSRPPRGFGSWDAAERSLAWSYVALGIADVYQTVHASDDGREANPFVSSWAGSQPDAAEVVAFKAATTWGLLEITRRWVHTGKRRKQVLTLLNGVQLGCVVHNQSVLEDLDRP
jgi:hypothetical protein